ncbi:O-antigen ligase family protein [Macrococcus armenti]|uniref:O-antigen ligase family protein n=1 Tax=Macrococcus armenti TaxID=2875764 RepID=UPI001CCC93B1|nr:O-antigen ligase family protein [Macrococcus armenti]UBH16130.1 O-antigen ligase family protein [Macrococcus armenti]UBH18490.1 O-antigen ligase family protein [Macrococcus armenti]UBH20757.1 O-antigen ligase family protein [Macrococcus armenti]
MNINQSNLLLTFLTVLCITPLFLPIYFYRFHTLNLINSALILLIFIIFITLNLLYIKKINILIVLSLCFFLWRFYSSYYISHGITDLNNIICALSIVLVFNFYSNRNITLLLNAIFILFSGLLLFNLLTQFIFPNGLFVDNPRSNLYRPGWLFGIDNAFIYYISPMISVIIFRSIYLYNRITLFTFFLICSSLISIFLAHSATGIVSLLLLYSLMIIYRIKSLNKIFNFISLSILYIIIWIFVVRINSFKSFEYFIVDLLGKDLTFSGRTRIWNVAFDVLKEHLWVGNGIGYTFKVSYTYFVAHNQLLQLIIESGLIGLVLFVSIIILVGNKIQVTKILPEKQVILSAIFIFFIAGLTETYPYTYIFLLLTIGYNLPIIMKKKEI